MADPIRFFFDEHQRNSVVRALRRRGVDAITAYEAQRCGKPDPDQFRLTTVEGRTVVTFDSDFLALAADFQLRGEEFSGVVYCPPGKYMLNPRLQIRELLTLFGVLNADDMRNHVEYL